MLYSKIIQDNILYVLLHAEQVFQNFSRFDHRLGFFTSELTRDTVERVGVEIKKIADISSIIIDCNGLDDSHNSFNELNNIIKYCIEKQLDVSLIRVSESLYGKLQMYKIMSENNLQESHKKISHETQFKLFAIHDINFDDFDDFVLTIFSRIILDKKKLYAEDRAPDKQYSESSNVILPKYLNIKRFIEEKEISFIGLYLLCKKTINEGLIPNIGENNRPVIVFPSIAASYLASLFAKISCCDIAYRDHIGPKNKIYRTIQKGVFNESKKHLIISDVVCMGTEIQITKNIIEHEGAKVDGILTIIDVKVTDKTSTNKVISLVVLTKENNKGINYQIKTNFSHE